MAELLVGAGHDVTGTGNADRSDYTRTLIVTRPGLLARAERVAADIGFGVPTPGRTPRGVDVVVIVGLDAPAS